MPSYPQEKNELNEELSEEIFAQTSTNDTLPSNEGEHTRQARSRRGANFFTSSSRGLSGGSYSFSGGLGRAPSYPHESWIEERPLETEIEWDIKYVEVEEVVENVVEYPVVVPEDKIVEIPVIHEVIKEVEVEQIVHDVQPEVTVTYEYVDRPVVKYEPREVEVIDWKEVIKEVPRVTYETVIEDVYEDEPYYVPTEEVRIKTVPKRVEKKKIVEVEEFEEEVEVIYVPEDIEIRRPKIVEVVKEVPVVKYVDVEKVVEVKVPKIIYDPVEVHIPSEPNVVEIMKEVEEVSYEDQIEYIDEDEWEDREVEIIREKVHEVVREVETPVYEPTYREVVRFLPPQKLVEHPESGDFVPLQDFIRSFPEFEVIIPSDEGSEGHEENHYRVADEF